MPLPQSILAVIAMLTIAISAHAGVLHIENGHFVDAHGGTILLRGFNLSQRHKLPPFRPNTDPQLFAKLKEAGVNIVRLQFNWEAYELAPGVYDESYLDYYAGVLNGAGTSGIYVFIDIHQDAYSRWSLDGCGEGFPRWAIPSGFAQTAPDNGAKCFGWPLRVLLQRTEMERLFNAFYAPGNQARAHYLQLLDRLATRFAGNPFVAGYDLLNEPLGDAQLLMQLYTEGIAIIRHRDPSAIAFLSPEMLTGAGIEETKLPAPRFGNVAFAPHYYDPLVYAYLWLGWRYEPVAAKNRELARRWGAAVMLGEFGAPPSPLTTPYLQMIYEDLDRFGDSSTQWSYTPEWNPVSLDGWNYEDLSVIDDHGNFRSNFTLRPYARRTAGTYGSMNVKTRSLFAAPSATFTWTNQPALGSTEIFIPRNFFGARAARISVQGAGLACSHHSSEQVLSCYSASAGIMKIILN